VNHYSHVSIGVVDNASAKMPDILGQAQSDSHEWILTHMPKPDHMHVGARRRTWGEYRTLWTESDELDKTGHNEGIGLVRRIPELLTSLLQRVESLLEAGWNEVRVVTDHGWLLMPRGLPKSELPKFLTATRWRRCAVVKPNATVDVPCFPWYWADDVRVASPPGIDCFLAGEEYNHGGLSLQECVVPQIVIRPGGGATVSAKIESFKWAGLRCRVKVSGDYYDCSIDLRDKAADPGTSLTRPKAVAKDGSAALVITNESREGTATTLVLLDLAGNLLDKAPVTVGE